VKTAMIGEEIIMPKFIYVFNEEDRDVLKQNGYNLLKNDNEQDIYIFENKNDICFAFGNMEYVLSDTLTF